MRRLFLLGVGVIFFVRIAGAFGVERIGAVDIRGNVRIEADSIKNKLEHQPGVVFSERIVREEINRLYDMGYFDRVHVSKSPIGKDRIKLIYVVRELPQIREIEIVGNNDFDRKDMLKEMEIKQFEVASTRKIERSLQKLKTKYKQKGYYLADLSYELVPLKDPTHVKLLISVREYHQLKVRKIVFIGNRAFSDNTLKGVMLSKEGSPLSILSKAGQYHELMFDRDVHQVRLWYLDHGYAKVKVYDPQIMFSADRRWVTLQISVEEGLQYDFGEVEFSGDSLFNDQELRTDSWIESGDLFRSSVLQREIKRLSTMYGDEGYAFANVIPNVTLDDDTLVANIVFQFEKGNQVTVRRINIVGNTKTYDKVIRRELRIYEGELFNSTARAKSERNVNRLGFFKKVAFRDKVVTSDPDLMDIEIEVEEKSTGALTVGAGFNTQDGFIATARIVQQNFLGSGRMFQLSGQYAGSRSRFAFGFEEPYLMDFNLSFGLFLYYVDSTVYSNIGVSFVQLKIGGEIRFGIPISDELGISLSYKLERITLKDVFNSSVITASDNEGYLSSSTLALTYDSRNNRFRPTGGVYATASGEFAGLGGDFHYFKAVGSIRWYIPLFWKVVYRSNLQLGAIFPVGSHAIPVSERFVLGGIDSIRGYRASTVGPMVCAEPTRKEGGKYVYSPSSKQFFCNRFGKGPNGLNYVSFNIGGRFMLVLNTELQFPLFEQLGMDFVVFLDIGTSLDRLDSKQNKPSTDPKRPFFPSPVFRVAIGWGIRWMSPIGPLRLEFGYPLVKALEEESFVPQFAISYAF